jgi:hypothetical protein
MVASSASRSSVVSVSAGGAKAMSSCMGSEPPEAVCSVFAACGDRFQVKTRGCRSGAKKCVAKCACRSCRAIQFCGEAFCICENARPSRQPLTSPPARYGSI